MELLNLQAIRGRADVYDQTGDWPGEDLAHLAAAGALRWAIARQYGGDRIDPLELHQRYESLAEASIATALILTQRDSAVGLIESGDNAALRDNLLPRLARNELFATVGIAQLTTSRQGGDPALVARRVDGGWQLDGVIPWSSGADRSQFVVAGAAVDDPANPSRGSVPQILFTLSTTWPGVNLAPCMPLVALQATHTGSISCEQVMLEDRFVLRGPTPNVLAGRKKSVPIPQAFLALGLCRAGIRLIEEHNSDLARETAKRFQDRLAVVRDAVLRHCDPATTPEPDLGARLRGECNDLALRITHAAVAIYKGSALIQGHPASRLAREALFLLVWSCPNPVIDCTVELLRSC